MAASASKKALRPVEKRRIGRSAAVSSRAAQFGEVEGSKTPQSDGLQSLRAMASKHPEPKSGPGLQPQSFHEVQELTIFHRVTLGHDRSRDRISPVTKSQSTRAFDAPTWVEKEGSGRGGPIGGPVQDLQICNGPGVLSHLISHMHGCEGCSTVWDRKGNSLEFLHVREVVVVFCRWSRPVRTNRPDFGSGHVPCGNGSTSFARRASSWLSQKHRTPRHRTRCPGHPLPAPARFAPFRRGVLRDCRWGGSGLLPRFSKQFASSKLRKRFFTSSWLGLRKPASKEFWMELPQSQPFPTLRIRTLKHIGFGSGPDPCEGVGVRPLPWRAQGFLGYVKDFNCLEVHPDLFLVGTGCPEILSFAWASSF